jgi:hypothetical protein
MKPLRMWRRDVHSADAAPRPYGRHLALTYLALGGFVVVGAVVVESSPGSAAVQRYGPNLVTDVLGILVTVVVVERLLAWQRERAAAPIRTVALRRVWHQLNRLTHMLLFSYKAAAPPGSPQPTSLDALLAAWQVEARHLDFRRPYGPDGPPRSWLRYGAEVAAGFEEGIRDLTDRYLDVLGADFPAAAEDLIDHPVFQFLRHGAEVEGLDAQYGWDIPRLSFVVASMDEPESDSLTEVAALVSRIYDSYAHLGGRPLTLDARLYEDHLSPAWSSARFDPHTDGEQ